MRKKSNALSPAMIPLLLVTLIAGCCGLGAKSSVLTQSEMLPIIPKGSEYTAIWDGKLQTFVAEQDRIAVPEGNYVELLKLDK